ncbi:MAG TPA: hypothetical protein VGX21_13205 [Methylomirabilota bacterium]|jgi:uncharacterized alpha-E superfamily protein|nr:hypothetical protein [Methylomirabilota bacterium]
MSDPTTKELLDQIREAVDAGQDLGKVQYELVAAAVGVPPTELSDKAQRTLFWVTGFDQPTTAGLVELLNAARRAARLELVHQVYGVDNWHDLAELLKAVKG